MHVPFWRATGFGAKHTQYDVNSAVRESIVSETKPTYCDGEATMQRTPMPLLTVAAASCIIAAGLNGLRRSGYFILRHR